MRSRLTGAMHARMGTESHTHAHLRSPQPGVSLTPFRTYSTALQSKLSGMQDERGFYAKVTDFGLAMQLPPFQESVKKVRGTEAYLPMQVFLDKQISQATDIYALGLVLWEIYHGLLWAEIWHTEKQRRG